jgi:predicted nucleotidyltransferase
MNRKEIAIEFAKSLKHSEIVKIILFGSVARGEDNIDSDIDILIITKNMNDKIKIEDDIYSKVFNILLNTNEYLSVKMRSINHYENHKDFPFYENIANEGILIG